MKRGLAAFRRVEIFLRGRLGRPAIAYVVLAVALILTGLAYLYVRENVEEAERARFQETVASTVRAVDRRMVTYVDAMLDGRGLFAASENVTREEWNRYVVGSDLLGRYPGIQAVGFARRVPLAQREAHAEDLREEEGFGSYAVRPSGERYEYFPLIFVEPDGGKNRVLYGRDFYADRVNRDAMEQARDSGEPRATGKVDLAEAGISEKAGFLVYTPVYRDGAPQETPDERRRALQGFIVSVFRPGELLEDIFGGKVDPGIDFEVFDGAEVGRGSLLHDDDGVLHAADPSYDARFQDVATLEVAGRIWSLHFSTLPTFGTGNGLPLFVLASGVIMSFMLFGITWMLASSRIQAERVGVELEHTNSELEETNSELGKANRELESTVRELEAFSYSVSHDLRAPLRSIEGFSQILLEDHAPQLDEDGRGHLGRVRAASHRMALLIDGLLDLSRVTRSSLRWQRVDLSAIAAEVAVELTRREPERETRFVISEDLVANGDPRLLGLVLENLLGNAWKFTRDREPALIEFGVSSEDEAPGATVYYVGDNGAGFDAAYADKLFGAFQRLHGPEEFEGTGIGLATVQRIVHRHGGRVWAKSAVGEGATFFFTLGERGAP